MNCINYFYIEKLKVIYSKEGVSGRRKMEIKSANLANLGMHRLCVGGDGRIAKLSAGQLRVEGRNI